MSLIEQGIKDSATTLKCRITFTEELLGTAPADEELYKTWVASKAPDASTLEDEVATLGVDEAADKTLTVFHKFTEDDAASGVCTPEQIGTPFLYDYTWKGLFKDNAKILKKIDGLKQFIPKAYRQETDGLVFVFPRKIALTHKDGTPITQNDMSVCHRPLRASTPMGERIALAHSETVPAGSMCEFEVCAMTPELALMAQACLEYGEYKGSGQWRNSGKGRYTIEFLDDAGNVIDPQA